MLREAKDCAMDEAASIGSVQGPQETVAEMMSTSRESLALRH